MKTVLITGGIVVGLMMMVSQYSRVAYESPDYEVRNKDGAFEVRVYPDLNVVTTSMAGWRDESGFMKLFNYISGQNQAGQKIAMTTPVLVTDPTDKPRMSFIVPAELAPQAVPEPKSSDLSRGQVTGGRFAVYRFSGSWNPQTFAAAEPKLRTWMESQGLKPTGSPIHAGYDPPMTPSFLRRNEILIRLAD